MRKRFDWLRKLAAVLLVLTSAVVGMVGLGVAVGDLGPSRLLALPLLLLMPVGIWAATRITPEGGTSGYCDQNI